MITRTLEFEQKIKDMLEQCDLDQLAVREQGLLLTAVCKLYQATDDTYFKDYVYDAINRMTAEDGKVNVLNASNSADRYILANVFFFIYKLEKQEKANEDNKFKRAILSMALALADHPRNAAGIFVSCNDGKCSEAKLADAYATQIFYMNYESTFGGKEHYNDIIAQFNSLHAELYKGADLNSAVMYLCALIDTMEVMEQPLYEIFHRLQDYLKEDVKDHKIDFNAALVKEQNDTALLAVYGVLKACRMKALITEKYERIGEEILNAAMEDADQSITAELIMAYGEGIRNRAYQDYGRNKGGILWS